MGANFILYALPRCELTEQRLEQLKERVKQLTPDEMPTPDSSAEDFLGWRAELLNCIDQLSGAIDSGEVSDFCNFWVTGGLSNGDRPTQAAEVFDPIADSPLYPMLEKWQTEDEERRKANSFKLLYGLRTQVVVELGGGYQAVPYNSVSINGTYFSGCNTELPDYSGPFAVLLPNGRAAMGEDGLRPYNYPTIVEVRRHVHD